MFSFAKRSLAISLTIAYLIKYLRDNTFHAEEKIHALEEEKQNLLVCMTDSTMQLSQAIGKESMMMKEI
ncbi:MAG: hypothetical protein AAF770_03125 [Bacteroidota bacterium]